MRYEPPINRARLLATVRDLYRLPAEELLFVPVGYAAACYILQCADGVRYFLKLWPAARADPTSPVHLERVLRLTRALHERALLPRVPYPLATPDGALWASVAEGPFAVFPFLPGHVPPPWPAWPASLCDELAGTIAALHRATPALADVLPPREDFTIPFEADLRRGLAEIARVGPRARTGLRALRHLLWPRREEIEAQLARLHGLQPTVHRLAGPFVLCHTDIGPANLLVDDQNRFSILDWDDATVAPPEHDLQAALADSGEVDFRRFLQVYDGAGGSRPLHLDHFTFYLLRRYLGDMTVRLMSIVDENTTDDEDQDALGGIEMWGFAQWSQLDETLARVAAAL